MDAKQQYTRTVTTKDHNEGTWVLVDQRGDPTWGDVEAVESHRRPDGSLGIVINHRDFNKALSAHDWRLIKVSK
jgi:hypothetical protein